MKPPLGSPEMATIGQRLGEARRNAGLSVADVAHETHIHSNMIYSIEEDDFSNFASVAYAKSFIKNYAEFLDVDLGEAMEALDSSKTLRLGEHELMGEMKKTIKKDRIFRLQRNPKLRRRLNKPGGAPIFLNIILFSLITAIVVFYFLGYKASSPEEARDEIAKGLQKANPFGGDETDGAIAGVQNPAETNPEEPSDFPAPNREETAPVLKRVELPLENARTPQNPAPKVSPAPVGEGGLISRMQTPGYDPVEPIDKPEVIWEVGESQPSPLAHAQEREGAPAPRRTPEIELEEGSSPDSPLPEGAPLPVDRSTEEPVAPLRPAGTTPPAVPEEEAVESAQRESGSSRLRS
ncbi:MAG: helix-turn-helix domain-containing protein, partial [Verrucomicrobiota bacterium]